ncbi:MAG TPA: YtxH domain-containing protein [Gemmatimonadales bacterium]|nr:YtxH domain-containing protein [Gemmatimonadales bacterium]
MTTEKGQLEEAAEAEIGDTAHGRAGFLVGVVFGAFLGAGIAMMLAPDRGNKTRRRLRRRMQLLREGALDSLDQAGSRTRKELSRRKRRLRAELERIREKARERARD